MHPYSFHDLTVAAGLQSCHFTALVQSHCSHIVISVCRRLLPCTLLLIIITKQQDRQT